MNTSFSKTQMEFSKKAHQAAQTQFYGPLFAGAPVVFEDTVGTTRDLDYAIDCQVAVTVRGLRAPLRFAVQERWRRPDPFAMKAADVTITEWNLASNQPSELHKLGAHLVVYGFFDDRTDRIVEAWAIDVARLLLPLALGRLPYERRKRASGDQTFLGFKFADLDAHEAVIFHLDNRLAAAA